MQPDFVFMRDESHEDRDLHATCTACPTPVRAETKDERLGGIVQITPDDTQVVIPVGPTGHASRPADRPVDRSADRQPTDQLRRKDHLSAEEGSSLLGFNNSAVTDQQGQIMLPGLVPRWKFDLTTWTKPENGPAKSWTLGWSLRDIPALSIWATSSWVLRTNDRGGAGPGRHASRFSSPTPTRRAELAKCLKSAGEENKRVLILFGGNWSEWCFKLHELLKANAEIEPLVKRGFVVVLVDANANRKLLESYAVHDEGVPRLSLRRDARCQRNRACEAKHRRAGSRAQALTRRRSRRSWRNGRSPVDRGGAP